MAKRTREIVGSGTADLETGGPSLQTGQPGTSVLYQLPDPTLAVVEVTQTAGQVLHQ